MFFLFLSLACAACVACFHPFLHAGAILPQSASSTLREVFSANLQNIKARITKNVEIEAKECLFSDGVMVFSDVYVSDQNAGKLHAKKVIWTMGSELLTCSDLIDGCLHSQPIALESSHATYNLTTGILDWDSPISITQDSK